MFNKPGESEIPLYSFCIILKIPFIFLNLTPIRSTFDSKIPSIKIYAGFIIGSPDVTVIPFAMYREAGVSQNEHPFLQFRSL